MSSFQHLASQLIGAACVDQRPDLLNFTVKRRERQDGKPVGVVVAVKVEHAQDSPDVSTLRIGRRKVAAHHSKERATPEKFGQVSIPAPGPAEHRKELE